MGRLVAAAAQRPSAAVLVFTRRARLASLDGVHSALVLGPRGQVLEQGPPAALLASDASMLSRLVAADHDNAYAAARG